MDRLEWIVGSMNLGVNWLVVAGIQLIQEMFPGASLVRWIVTNSQNLPMVNMKLYFHIYS